MVQESSSRRRCGGDSDTLETPPPSSRELEWSELLGPTLLDADGRTLDVIKCLHRKIVGLLFGGDDLDARFQQLQSHLLQAYNKLHEAGTAFEVVHIPGAGGAQYITAAMQGMPWLLLPDAGGRGAESERLLNRYRMQSTPALLLLDQTGALLTRSGRQHILSDPECKGFPWAAEDFAHLMSSGLFVDASGNQHEPAELAGKSLALFFGRNGCTPCSRFAEQFARMHAAMAAAGSLKGVQFLAVSEDTCTEDFAEFSAGRPWLFVPFEPAERRLAFVKLFPHFGTPSLLTVGPSGTVLSDNARKSMLADADGSAFPWKPCPLADLAVTTVCAGIDLNERPSVVCLMEHCSAEQQAVLTAALAAVAAPYIAAGAAAGSAPALLFFTAAASSKAARQVRRMTQYPKHEAAPALFILDIAQGYVHYKLQSTVLSAASIAQFCSEFQQGKLTSSPIAV
jgi:Thioredoxin-like